MSNNPKRITLSEFTEKLKQGDPDAYSELGTRYEIVSCACKHADCQGWQIQLTQQATHAMASEIDAIISKMTIKETSMPTNQEQATKLREAAVALLKQAQELDNKHLSIVQLVPGGHGSAHFRLTWMEENPSSNEMFEVFKPGELPDLEDDLEIIQLDMITGHFCYSQEEMGIDTNNEHLESGGTSIVY